MTASKTPQKDGKPNKTAIEKTKTLSPKTVPNNTLESDQCRSCKNSNHIIKDSPNLT